MLLWRLEYEPAPWQCHSLRLIVLDTIAHFCLSHVLFVAFTVLAVTGPGWNSGCQKTAVLNRWLDNAVMM
eukprot:scaffold8450_cov215-Amphora_coffeaeformis.AAC.1